MLLAPAPPARAGGGPGAAAAADSLAGFPPPRVRAWQTGALRSDRLEHASLAFTLTAGLLVASRDAPLAAAVVLALGVGKEQWDRRAGGRFDAVDLAADAGGVALAVVCVRARGQ